MTRLADQRSAAELRVSRRVSTTAKRFIDLFVATVCWVQCGELWNEPRSRHYAGRLDQRVPAREISQHSGSGPCPTRRRTIVNRELNAIR